MVSWLISARTSLESVREKAPGAMLSVMPGAISYMELNTAKYPLMCGVSPSCRVVNSVATLRSCLSSLIFVFPPHGASPRLIRQHTPALACQPPLMGAKLLRPFAVDAHLRPIGREGAIQCRLPHSPSPSCVSFFCFPLMSQGM